ncbi:MAG: glycosyl hydrolase 115 family protein, partial [Prevotella sp.]
MNKLLFLLFPVLLILLPQSADASEFVWYDGSHPVSVKVEGKATPVVSTALQLFSSDMLAVTGHAAVTAPASRATIRVIQLDCFRGNRRQLSQAGVPVDSLLRVPDAFYIGVVQGRQWLVVGSNGRGAAYGLLQLSRLAGVSPWIWWNDVKPQPRTRLTVDASYHDYQRPSVTYRGIFINDEDWTLQPWSWTNYSPAKPGLISAATYRRVFQLLMRLRANAIWPAMHGSSVPFYRVPGAKEAADSCGIVIGTSHCEPLMRNNVGEWDVAKRGRYNYITNSDEVKRYWIERLQEVNRYENIYTIGMRGIHDGSMEGVKTMDEKQNALQRVIDDQRKLLAKYVNKDVTKVPQQFVPYKEVLSIYERGLRVPDDVMLTWCDDNYGYMTRLSDSAEQKRTGGGGVYYHLSYWGRPHDYLWLTTTQPGLIVNEMREAWDHNVRRLWIVNVHDVKIASYDLELFLDMAWNINCVRPESVGDHLAQWLQTQFGSEVGKELLPVMRQFYRLCAERKPEFMGWNQNELNKKVYPRGLSPVKDSEFSESEFGGELYRFLDQWQGLADKVDAIAKRVPRRCHDAYFAMITYPVKSGAAMARKCLEAQRARNIARGSYDSHRWLRDSLLYTTCANSQQAYQTIRSLTRYYNDSLAGGKWKGLMCDIPRDQYVFFAPKLPVMLTDEEVKQYATSVTSARPLDEKTLDGCVARNACNYSSADKGITVVDMLGHSNRAVSLPKGKQVNYQFDVDSTGAAKFTVALIPTQPNDKGDLRFSVQIDGDTPKVFSLKEPYRSEQWKLNVLRGQALKSWETNLSKGSHTLTIRALDEHLLVDQWMVDFNPSRKFYLIPTKII